MWTPERDHELRRLGAKDFAERYRTPLEEASARYMVLFDPAGQAALLRENVDGVSQATRACWRAEILPSEKRGFQQGSNKRISYNGLGRGLDDDFA